MEVQLVQAHPRVSADAGKVAIQRGPVIYCLEETDNGPNLADIVLKTGVPLGASYDAGLLGGVVVITGEATRSELAAWENRKPGEMLVWIRYQ